MIRTLNATNINMALRCGEQFRRRYIEGERIPPSAAAGRGRGVHAANEENCRQKVVTRQDLPADVLTDVARDAFVRSFEDGVFLSREMASEKPRILNDELNRTVALTRLYRTGVAPLIQPLETELWLTADIGLEVPLGGYLDHTEVGHQIGDIKSSYKSWAESNAASELQPAIYGFLYHHEFGAIPTFNYDVLVLTRSGNQSTQRFPVEISDQKMEAALRIAHRVYSMIRSGVFLPADPSSWICSERWCGYFLTCPYVGNGRRVWI